MILTLKRPSGVYRPDQFLKIDRWRGGLANLGVGLTVILNQANTKFVTRQCLARFIAAMKD
jgi:hypothetical protein